VHAKEFQENTRNTAIADQVFVPADDVDIARRASHVQKSTNQELE
jgi:hypothetical protein